MAATITKISNKTLTTRHTQQPGTVTKISSTGLLSDTFDDVIVQGTLILSGSPPAYPAATAITAGTTRTQAGATVLTKGVNRVDTSTAPTTGTILGDGVRLPTSIAGEQVIVINNTANPIQVYGAGTDTINGVATATGIAIPANALQFFQCSVAGAWNAEVGGGYSGAIGTLLAANAITAAGTTQATGTQLGATINTIGTVAAGTGVNLPASAPGLAITIIHAGVSPLLVYPLIGATDTINGIAATIGVTVFPGSVATFMCTAAGAWTTQPATTKSAAFNTNTTTVGATLTAANVTGGTATVDLALTGTLGGAANIQLPTVAAMTLAMHAPTVGSSFRLRIVNESSANFAWTVTTNTGWTLTGTMSISQNVFRDFVVTLTSLTTAVLQNVGTGTFS